METFLHEGDWYCEPCAENIRHAIQAAGNRPPGSIYYPEEMDPTDKLVFCKVCGMHLTRELTLEGQRNLGALLERVLNQDPPASDPLFDNLEHLADAMEDLGLRIKVTVDHKD